MGAIISKTPTKPSIVVESTLTSKSLPPILSSSTRVEHGSSDSSRVDVAAGENPRPIPLAIGTPGNCHPHAQSAKYIKVKHEVVQFKPLCLQEGKAYNRAPTTIECSSDVSKLRKFLGEVLDI
jgi:hypothetical protein